jgi:general stress protein YciG
MTEMNNNNEMPRSGNGSRTSKSRRGFASMDPLKQKEIASKGGRAAHEQGVAHEWSSDEARAAGRKGGEAVSRNKDHMSEIGRRGGEASHSSRSEEGPQ